MGIDPLTLGALAIGGSAAGSLGAGAMNSGAVRDTNAANILFQKETNAKNEALMRESWSRDDSSVLRRAQDLQRAGLSKTLAAGSAAAASSPIKLESPRVQANTAMGDAVQNVAGNLGMMPGKLMQLRIGNSQADLMNNQYLTETAKQENLNSGTIKNLADAGLKDKLTKISDQDIETFIKTGGLATRGDTSALGKLVRGSGGLLSEFGDKKLSDDEVKAKWAEIRPQALKALNDPDPRVRGQAQYYINKFGR